MGRRHVLLAPERARRGAPALEPFTPDPAPCDFCGGREERTPPETYSIRDPDSVPDTPGWRVRVVPNLYPATPLHEVVVHTPDHHEQYEDAEAEHRCDVLRAYRSRLQGTTPAVVVVWNRGKAAGASRSHAHGQIFGLESVPPTLERESRAFDTDPCALCAIGGDAELQITDVGGVRLMAHPVPFVADELLIVPPCIPRFEELDDDALTSVADVVAVALRSIGNTVPYNLVFHTAPREVERFHWHAHLMPRTAVWGGLEMGAELPIVAADPYETARRLRTV